MKRRREKRRDFSFPSLCLSVFFSSYVSWHAIFKLEARSRCTRTKGRKRENKKEHNKERKEKNHNSRGMAVVAACLCVGQLAFFIRVCFFFSSFSFFSLSLGPLGHHLSHIIPWSHSNARSKTPIEFGLIFLGLFLFVVPDQNSHRFIGYNERVQLFVSKRYVCFGRGDRLVISRQWATQVSKDSRS